MALFNYFKKKNILKRREEEKEKAKIFVQVHFVREKKNYDPLLLKDDKKREKCLLWYEEHPAANTYANAVLEYLKEVKASRTSICDKLNVDSKYFEKLENTPQYIPAKKEAVATCLVLKLNIEHSRKLLEFAGYTLSNSSEADLVLRYCIENKINDIADVDYILSKICEKTIEEID